MQNMSGKALKEARHDALLVTIAKSSPAAGS